MVLLQLTPLDLIPMELLQLILLDPIPMVLPKLTPFPLMVGDSLLPLQDPRAGLLVRVQPSKSFPLLTLPLKLPPELSETNLVNPVVPTLMEHLKPIPFQRVAVILMDHLKPLRQHQIPMDHHRHHHNSMTIMISDQRK